MAQAPNCFIGDLTGKVEGRSTSPVFIKILSIASTSASALWAWYSSWSVNQQFYAFFVLPGYLSLPGGRGILDRIFLLIVGHYPA